VSAIVEIRTQDASQGLDLVLVTAGWERADHIVVQLQPDLPLPTPSLAVYQG